MAAAPGLSPDESLSQPGTLQVDPRRILRPVVHDDVSALLCASADTTKRRRHSFEDFLGLSAEGLLLETAPGPRCHLQTPSTSSQGAPLGPSVGRVLLNALSFSPLTQLVSSSSEEGLAAEPKQQQLDNLAEDSDEGSAITGDAETAVSAPEVVKPESTSRAVRRRLLPKERPSRIYAPTYLGRISAAASGATGALYEASCQLLQDRPWQPWDALALTAPLLFFSAPMQSTFGALVPSFFAPLAPVALTQPLSYFTSFGNFLQAEEHHIVTNIGLFSLSSALMFIASIRGLSRHATAKEGNIIGMLATALGILSILASPGFTAPISRFLLPFMVASVIGYLVAANITMEDMPQLVAGFHSFVGLAAVLVGFATFFAPAPASALRTLELCVGTAMGMLTFTGSIVAAGKLHGSIPGKPIIIDGRWYFNFFALAFSGVLTGLLMQPHVYASGAGALCLILNSLIWGALGVNMVLPIGGADMPVVVSVLNAFSGITTSAAGFTLNNHLLTITGALVTSSGFMLSDLMCKGINRSIVSVLLGGFGTDGKSSTAAVSAAEGGAVTEISAEGVVGHLLMAKRIVIVPGFGMAVARCTQRLSEIVSVLRERGVLVHFAVHPVAGRLPGHMNVLLAEANIPHEIVKEMDHINPDLPSYDVAIVVGGNDIVNPSAKTDSSSPIYQMPVIEVWNAKVCVVCKRSMGTGYSGVDNPLFYKENVRMLFGDAKTSLDQVFMRLDQCKDDIVGGAALDDLDANGQGAAQEQFPPAVKVVGVVREKRPGEKRVSITPSAVPGLRRLGFSLLLEKGAGRDAGFTDNEYSVMGGVRVGESVNEVLSQADVVLKVNEPLIEEIQSLRASQTFVGSWNMFGAEDVLSACKESPAAFVNIALVPRVSRAQKLDVLTSMANIAGYKAALQAFNHFGRLGRSAVTACGSVPPARVLVIGAGVAGLSAIATSHAIGAKVFANDVREAAREQVESLGAEFVKIDVSGMKGEGNAGYASVMSDEFTAAQLRTYAKLVPVMDIVITTAMIPNRAAPVLITEEMIMSMKCGSVIVDLAAQTGGNTALTVPDETTVSSNGVTIFAETNYPSSFPGQASDMLAVNYTALLATLGGAAEFGGDHWEDPIIAPATMVRGGQCFWPPPPRPAAVEPEVTAALVTPLLEAPEGEPSALLAVVDWLQENRSEVAKALGVALVIGFGLSTDIPAAELSQIGYLALSLLIGQLTVAGVAPSLHTPLVSVTNAISGIIVVGGMLQLGGPLISARVACAIAAVFLSSVNIAGGFAVTHRMIEMFDGASKDKTV